jgi:hypothetical protein
VCADVNTIAEGGTVGERMHRSQQKDVLYRPVGRCANEVQRKSDFVSNFVLVLNIWVWTVKLWENSFLCTVIGNIYMPGVMTNVLWEIR